MFGQNWRETFVREGRWFGNRRCRRALRPKYRNVNRWGYYHVHQIKRLLRRVSP